MQILPQVVVEVVSQMGLGEAPNETESPKKGDSGKRLDEVEGKLDQLIQLLGGAPEGPPPGEAGAMPGAETPPELLAAMGGGGGVPAGAMGAPSGAAGAMGAIGAPMDPALAGADPMIGGPVPPMTASAANESERGMEKAGLADSIASLAAKLRRHQ